MERFLCDGREGKAIDPSHYRGMIGTLLYLTASRHDLQFAICMCAQYQAWPIEKHLHAVKKIFRYLCRTVNQGLWYPKDSSVALTTFVDADHAGCQDTRHSTSSSLQFLGDRLISWSSKRQKSAAISSTKAEYIALGRGTEEMNSNGLITQRIAEALDAYEANKNNGNKNRNGNENGIDNRNVCQDSGSGSRRTLPTTRGCTMVLEEENKLERFIWGLSDSNYENVTSSKVTRLKKAIHIANSLMDQKVRVYAAKQADKKRRMKNNPRDNHAQKPPYKRDRKGTTIVDNQRAPVANQRTLTCFECGNQGHYHNEFQKLKNQNGGNQARSSDAPGRVYALGRGEAD
nr:uncharacterized mitochondrial protein AtMg00810-like [Tanacetum cinerariifolium]